MTQKTNLPGKYNPLKASYYGNQHQSDPEMDAKIATIWERIKTSNPALYRKHLREEAASDARRILFEATLDDPESIAVFNDFMLDSKQQHFADELALLGLEAGATKRDIKNAYRRKARKLHPDKGGSNKAM